MADFPWGQLITAGGTLGGAALGGWIGHWLGRDKHKRERTWEKRVETCGEILQSLQRAGAIFQAVQDSYAEDPHRAFADDDVRSRASRGYGEIAKAAAAYRAGFLFLSPEFIEKFEAWEAAYARIDDFDPPSEIDGVVTEISRALPVLSAQAQRDAR